MSKAQIRWAEPGDELALLKLMQALATFEGYRDQFAVTESALNDVLFQRKTAQALVAEIAHQPIGMLVFYPLPFTYDLKPWWLMKELYVEPAYRNDGVGEQLFSALTHYAKAQGGSRIRWDVLSTNLPAQRFYQRQGARHNQNWQLFDLTL